MEDVSKALVALASVVSTHKKESVRAAQDKANNVVYLLGLSSSQKVVSQISAIFEHGLKILYQSFPRQTLDFSAAVLRAIVQEKVLPAVDDKTRYIWENVQKSIVSSVIDALEAHPTDAMKSSTACALYGTIRDLYYADGRALDVLNHNLIFNVNLLLSESSNKHPENQSQLRSDRVLGANIIASTILHTRDYFVLDSILGLLGAILPDRTLAAAKRTAFIDSVFSPAKFLCSGQIKGHMNAPGGIWDDVVAKVINECLANVDISYPQPFRIVGLQTSSKLPKFLDPLYVDKEALFVNVDLDETIDSYIVPFSNVNRASLSGGVADLVLVTMDLKAPPMLGPHNPFASHKGGPTVPETFSFRIKSADRGRFVKTLRARGIADRLSDQVERKVSKLQEGLSLEHATLIGRPVTQQERVAKVQQLWKSNGDDLDADDDISGPTSPLLVPQATVSLHSPARSSPIPVDRIPSTLKQAAFRGSLDIENDNVKSSKKKTIDNDKKTQIGSASPIQKDKRKIQSSARMRIVDSDSEMEDMAKPDHDKGTDRPTSRSRLRTAKAIEESSRDDTTPVSSPVEDVDDSDFEPTQQPTEPTSRATRATRATTKKGVAKEALKKDQTRSRARGKETGPDEQGEPKRKPEKDTKTTAKKKTTDHHTSGKRSRPSDEDENVADNMPPVKRQRPMKAKDSISKPDAHRRDSVAIFGPTTVPPAKKRYGKKAGRTSSPERAKEDDVDVDFDELPNTVSAKSTAKAEGHPEPATRKGRAAAMKARGGRKPTQTNTSSAKSKVEILAENVPEQKSVPHDVLVDPVKTTRTNDDHARAPTPASMEVQPTINEKQPKLKSKSKPLKPKKAPWEDMHLHNEQRDLVAATSDDHALKSNAAMEDDVEYTDHPEPLPFVTSSDPAPLPQDSIGMTLDEDIPLSKKPVQINNLTSQQAYVQPAPSSPILALPILNSNPAISEPLVLPNTDNAAPIPSVIAIPALVSTLATQAVTEPKTVQTPVTTPPMNSPKPFLAPRLSHFVPTPPAQCDTPVVTITKLPSLFKQPIPQAPTEHLSSPPCQARPASPIQRKIQLHKYTESPFLERVLPRESVTFARSPSPVYELVQRGRVSHHKHPQQGRLRSRRQSHSPMQIIIETLNEINEVVVEKIANRFQGVRHDVRVGRDNLLQQSNAEQSQHCGKYESTFNVLVDLEEQYSAYHRQVIARLEDVEQASDVLGKGFVQIMQQHDRHTLAKKVPTTSMLTVPSVLRRPVLAF